MILKAIPLKDYNPKIHRLPEAGRDLRPGQFVVLAYDDTGKIVAMFREDVRVNYPPIGMGLVMQETKRSNGVLLAKKGGGSIPEGFEVEEIWIVEDDTTFMREVSIKWEDVEISGSSGVYPREEGESGVSFFQRSFIDDAMDEALKKPKADE